MQTFTITDEQYDTLAVALGESHRHALHCLNETASINGDYWARELWAIHRTAVSLALTDDA